MSVAGDPDRDPAAQMVLVTPSSVDRITFGWPQRVPSSLPPSTRAFAAIRPFAAIATEAENPMLLPPSSGPEPPASNEPFPRILGGAANRGRRGQLGAVGLFPWGTHSSA
jgi:hypothetical protein